MEGTQVKGRRRLCSCDMAEVPADCYVLHEESGEMFFCGPRCLFLWAGTFVTKPSIAASTIETEYRLIEPEGRVRRFKGLWKVAQWSAANALRGTETEWFRQGLGAAE